MEPEEFDAYIEKLMKPGPFQDAEIKKALDRESERKFEQGLIDGRNFELFVKFVFVASVTYGLLKIIWNF